MGPAVQGPLGIAMRRRDFAFAAGYVSARLETDVTETEVESWVKKHADGIKHFGDCWSDCTWTMWFRNRVGPWQVGQTIHDVRFECEMHCFFIGIEETPEMLLRLCNENGKVPDRVARSKIGKTQLSEIQPIDAVAARVT